MSDGRDYGARRYRFSATSDEFPGPCSTLILDGEWLRETKSQRGELIVVREYDVQDFSRRVL
jgi:hypothetical protein